ncbi:MAG: DUF6067 family protein [Planctomycetota bacterium]|nr:DUF6067 family protein [Planctomycetota bacterium]
MALRFTLIAARALTFAAALLAPAFPASAVESPSSSGEVSTVDTPIVRVPMTAKPPTIDGTFTEGEWDDAAGLSGFWYDYGSADFRYLAPPQTQLQVYTTYDKENLYVAYVSPIYPEKSWMRARGRFPDVDHHPLYGLIWDDHVELEFRPTGDNVRGFQQGLFKWFVNPIGTISDMHWSPAGGWGRNWQSGAVVRCGVTDKTWVLEMAIPLKNFKDGDYAGKNADGTPVVNIPPPDGTSYRAWFTRSIGGNGDFFNAFDKHIWNTTKLKMTFDSQAPTFQVNDLGPIMEDNVDLKVTLKSHNTQSETIRLGFFVESAAGLVYSSYDAPELKDGLVELLPGETKKLRLRQALPGISKEGNVLWFDVRAAGQPSKTLFRTRLIDFHSMEGGAEGKLTFKARRIDVIERLRPPKKDFDLRYDFSPYRKRLAAVVDIGIHGASEEAKRTKEVKLLVTTADKDERTVAEQRVPMNGDFACAMLELPSLVDGEKYRLSVLLFDENKRIVGETSPDPFTYKIEPWMNNKLGLDDVVWEPYVVIQPAANGFETLKHKFTIDPSGLPAQIEIKPDVRELPLEFRAAGAKTPDADLLAAGRGPQLRAPIRLEAVVNGQRVVAQVVQPAKAVRTWKSEIEYESQLKVGPIEVALRTQYDCDGAMHAKMTYGASAPAGIDRFELVTDVAGQVDMVVPTMQYGGMQGPDAWECTLPAGEGVVWESGKSERPELYYSKFVPFIFFGSGDRGFTWYSDSDKPMIFDRDGSTMSLERDKAGNVTWRSMFVNMKAQVGEKRTVDFTILTHPSKPKPKEFRKLAWFYRGPIWAANYRIEGINLAEDYLKPRIREATGAPKSVPDDQLATFRNDTPPWNRYGRLRNEGVWPLMDRNFEDKAVYYIEQHIRIGRRVGYWWDETWPVYRSDNLAEGDAYMRDPKTIGKNEVPWQSGQLTGYMRDTFKRTSRIAATNNVPQRNYVWASNAATLYESTAWDTQLVEECGAAHRSYEIDTITAYPNSLVRYMAHNFTGLVCRVVADVGMLPAGDDPRMERQLYGRALINDFGVTPDGPHGRFLNPDHATRILKALQDFGYFEDQETEYLPYWRNTQIIRYGTIPPPTDRFSNAEANPAAKVSVAVYRRPFEQGGRKGYKAMIVLLNESSVPVREPLYLVQPQRILGGLNAKTANETAGTFSVAGLPENGDWKVGQLAARLPAANNVLLDLETNGLVDMAPTKEKGEQVFGPVFILPHDFRILYAQGFVK